MANYNNWGGRRAGAGRKSLNDETAIIDIFEEAVSRASKIRIVKAIVKKAEQGDIRAANLIMAYAFGRPIPVEKAGDPIDPDDGRDEFGMTEEDKQRAFEADVIRAYGDLDEEEEAELLSPDRASMSAAEYDAFHRDQAPEPDPTAPYPTATATAKEPSSPPEPNRDIAHTPDGRPILRVRPEPIAAANPNLPHVPLVRGHPP